MVLLAVGSLNREAPYFQGARGEGLVLFDFDEEALRFERLAAWPGVDNPTFLSVTADGRHIYANSEVAEWREGLVTAFAFDPAARRLTYLNMQPTLGSIAAHNAVSEDGRRLFVVNYTLGEGGPGQSLAVFDRDGEGGLRPAGASAAHQGRGPDPLRQERAHAHSVTELAPGLLLVTDLGLDALVTYRLDGAGLRRAAVSPGRPGAGPRHAALHPGGRLVLVSNELDATVTAHAVDAASGRLTLLDRQPAVPAGVTGSHCSDIRLSPDGAFLYVANRGHDSIAAFAVDAGEGRLTPLGWTGSGGAAPRQMTLSPSGRHLLVANQNSDRISLLAREAGTGALRDTGRGLAIGTPMCVKFAGQ